MKGLLLCTYIFFTLNHRKGIKRRAIDCFHIEGLSIFTLLWVYILELFQLCATHLQLATYTNQGVLHYKVVEFLMPNVGSNLKMRPLLSALLLLEMYQKINMSKVCPPLIQLFNNVHIFGILLCYSIFF